MKKVIIPVLILISMSSFATNQDMKECSSDFKPSDYKVGDIVVRLNTRAKILWDLVREVGEVKNNGKSLFLKGTLTRSSEWIDAPAVEKLEDSCCIDGLCPGDIVQSRRSGLEGTLRYISRDNDSIVDPGALSKFKYVSSEYLIKLN